MIGAKNVTLIIGDTIYHGENSRITSVSITAPQPETYSVLGSRKVFTTPGFGCHELSIDMLIPELNIESFSTTKISNKLVSNCSVEELLFAVRHKLNN